MYWLIIVLSGIIGGLFSGMFGIGGGSIIVPILTYFTDMGHFMAQGISLGALLAPVSLFAMLKYHQKGFFRIKEIIIIALSIIVSSYFGARISLSFNVEIIQKLFGIVLMVTGIHMFFFKNGKNKIN